MTKGRVGTWVKETADKNNDNTIKFMDGTDVVTPTKTENKNFRLEWARGYGPDNYWTPGTKKIFLNTEAKLAHNDGTALANFVCETKKQGDGGGFTAITPLVRSLLQWQ